MSTPDDETFATLRQRADELTLKNRAMDEAPMGITIADMHREDEPIVYANAGFERITGYGREEILGQNCRFLQGEGTDDEPVAAMRAAIEAQELVKVELLNYRKDGTAFWNEVTLTPIADEAGQLRYYVGFQQDITTRKEYALRIERQRDDLTLLNQLVRHDIRNDLQLVVSFAELLRDHVDEDGLEHVDVVLDSARHAVDLTDTAREMADVMLQSDSELEPIDLAEHLDEHLDDLASSYPAVALDRPSSIPPVRVRANGMLGSVFRNLLHNAVQHNDTDAPTVTVEAEREDDRVRVRVADDGPGVPEHLRDEIFGRGEKGPTSEGTGVGLYLVSTLVDRYGGDVRVEDNDPRGAVFVVELPVAD